MPPSKFSAAFAKAQKRDEAAKKLRDDKADFRRNAPLMGGEGNGEPPPFVEDPTLIAGHRQRIMEGRGADADPIFMGPSQAEILPVESADIQKIHMQSQLAGLNTPGPNPTKAQIDQSLVPDQYRMEWNDYDQSNDAFFNRSYPMAQRERRELPSGAGESFNMAEDPDFRGGMSKLADHPVPSSRAPSQEAEADHADDTAVSVPSFSTLVRAQHEALGNSLEAEADHADDTAVSVPSFSTLVRAQHEALGNSLEGEDESTPLERRYLAGMTGGIRESALRSANARTGKDLRQRPRRDATAIGLRPGSTAPEPTFREYSAFRDISNPQGDLERMMKSAGNGVHTPMDAEAAKFSTFTMAAELARRGRAGLKDRRKKLKRALRSKGEATVPSPAKTESKEPLWSGRATAPKKLPLHAGGKVKGVDEELVKRTAEPYKHRSKFKSGLDKLFAKRSGRNNEKLPGGENFAKLPRDLAKIQDVDTDHEASDFEDLEGFPGIADGHQRDAGGDSRTDEPYEGYDDDSQAGNISDYGDEDLDSMDVEEDENEVAEAERQRQQEALHEALTIGFPESKPPRRGSIDLGQSMNPLDVAQQPADARMRELLANRLPAEKPSQRMSMKTSHRDFEADLAPLVEGAKSFDADKRVRQREAVYPKVGEDIAGELKAQAERQRKGKGAVAEGGRLVNKVFSRTAEDELAAPYTGDIEHRTLTGPDALEQQLSGREMLFSNKRNGVYKRNDRPGLNEMNTERLRYQRHEQSPVWDVTNPQQLLSWERETEQRTAESAADAQQKQVADDYIAKRNAETGFTKFRRNIARSFKNQFLGRKHKLRDAKAESGRLGQIIAGRQEEQLQGDSLFGTRAVRPASPEGIGGAGFKAELQKDWTAARKAAEQPAVATTDQFPEKRAFLEDFYNVATDDANRYLNSNPKNIKGWGSNLEDLPEIEAPAKLEKVIDEPDHAPVFGFHLEASGKFKYAQQLARNDAMKGRANRQQNDNETFEQRKADRDKENARRKQARADVRPGLADLMVEKQKAFGDLPPERMLATTRSQDIPLPRNVDDNERGGKVGFYQESLNKEVVRRAERSMPPSMPKPLKKPLFNTEERRVDLGADQGSVDDVGKRSYDADVERDTMDARDRDSDGNIRHPAAFGALRNLTDRLDGQDRQLVARGIRGKRAKDEAASLGAGLSESRQEMNEAKAELARTKQAEDFEQQRSQLKKSVEDEVGITPRFDPDSVSHEYDMDGFRDWSKHKGVLTDRLGSDVPLIRPKFVDTHHAARERDQLAERQAAWDALSIEQKMARRKKGMHSPDQEYEQRKLQQVQGQMPVVQKLPSDPENEAANQDWAPRTDGSYFDDGGKANELMAGMQQAEKEQAERRRQETIQLTATQDDATVVGRTDPSFNRLSLLDDYMGGGVQKRQQELFKNRRGLDSEDALNEQLLDDVGPVNRNNLQDRLGTEDYLQAREAIMVNNREKNGGIRTDDLFGDNEETKRWRAEHYKKRIDAQWDAVKPALTREKDRRAKMKASELAKFEKTSRADVKSGFTEATRQALKADRTDKSHIRSLLQEYNSKRMAGDTAGIIKRLGASRWNEGPETLPGEDRGRLAAFLTNHEIDVASPDGDGFDKDTLDAYSQTHVDYVRQRLEGKRTEASAQQQEIEAKRREENEAAIAQAKQREEFEAKKAQLAAERQRQREVENAEIAAERQKVADESRRKKEPRLDEFMRTPEMERMRREQEEQEEQARILAAQQVPAQMAQAPQPVVKKTKGLFGGFFTRNTAPKNAASKKTINIKPGTVREVPTSAMSSSSGGQRPQIPTSMVAFDAFAQRTKPTVLQRLEGVADTVEDLVLERQNDPAAEAERVKLQGENEARIAKIRAEQEAKKQKYAHKYNNK